MSDRAKNSAKLGVLLVGVVLVAAVPDVAGLLGCSSSGGGPGTGGGGAAGTGSGAGGQAGVGGEPGGGNGGSSAASGGAGASGTMGSAGVSGTTGSGGRGGSGGTAGGGNDGGSDGPQSAPTITMLTPSSRHIGEGGFTLVVEGHDFPPNPYVAFDGNLFNTTVVSATRLEASIPGAALGATPRQVSVVVTQISGSSGNSNVLPFQILAAQDGG